MLDLPELLLDTEYGNPGMGLAKNKAPTKIFDSPGDDGASTKWRVRTKGTAAVGIARECKTRKASQLVVPQTTRQILYIAYYVHTLKEWGLTHILLELLNVIG